MGNTFRFALSSSMVDDFRRFHAGENFTRCDIRAFTAIRSAADLAHCGMVSFSPWIIERRKFFRIRSYNHRLQQLSRLYPDFSPIFSAMLYED